ncbi:MAG: glycosyltransferase family 4 protein [Alishewanella aestuarii]
MLIVTGLFFNKKGNQSFYNSVKGYTKNYKVTILTAATLSSDVYLELKKVEKEVDRVKIISVFPYKLFSLISIFLSFFKRMKLKIFKAHNSLSDNNGKSDKDMMLVNMQPTFKSKFSFYLRSYLLAASGIIYRCFNNVDVICCYEINGCIASVWLKKIFRIPVFIKLQGTALGGQLDLIGNEKFNKVFSIDIAEIKRSIIFDLAIMTNDGTRGDVVLKHYGFPVDKIFFLNNGIDSRFENAIKKSSPVFKNEKLKSINVCSVSRLTSWKRVDLILEVISEVRKIIEISYTLIGIGDEDESQAILKLIKKLNLEGNVTFIRGATTDEVIKVISNSDFLISINRFTNVSNPVFEALYIGVPVITISQSEFSDVLGPGMESCLFVEDSDRVALIREVVDKITRIVPESYNALTKNTENFRNYFPTWEVRSDRELAKIARILE